MQYADLKLKELREKVGLDYVSFTYLYGRCCCCNGPLDLKEEDWSPRAFERAGVKTLAKLREVEGFKFSYLQFLNTRGTHGEKTEKDELNDMEFIDWSFGWDKMDEVISELQQRLGEGYLIIKPEKIYDFIKIYRKDSQSYRNYLELKKANLIK